MTRFPCIGAYVPMQHEAKYDPFTRGISMRCHYCQHESGHDKTCPEAAPDIRQRFQRYAVWQLGYRSGFTTAEWGKNIGPADTWRLGWLRGDAARDERENGFDPRFEE